MLKENEDGTTNYDNQSNPLFVDGLKGKLLLAHGTLDDNELSMTGVLLVVTHPDSNVTTLAVIIDIPNLVLNIVNRPIIVISFRRAQFYAKLRYSSINSAASSTSLACANVQSVNAIS